MQMPAPDDWRLQGQEEYLKGLTLHWRKWHQTRPGWDHDHCEFCGAKFTEREIPESLVEGYTTKDEYHWICRQCAEDFRELFEWRIVE